MKQQLEDKNNINKKDKKDYDEKHNQLQNLVDSLKKQIKKDKKDYDEKHNQLQKDINKAENASLQANNSKIVLDNQLLNAQDRVSKLTLENETLKKKLKTENISLHANDSKEEIVNIKNK